MNLEKSFNGLKVKVEEWLESNAWILAILILFILGKEYLDKRKSKNATSQNLSKTEEKELEQTGGFSPKDLDKSREFKN